MGSKAKILFFIFVMTTLAGCGSSFHALETTTGSNYLPSTTPNQMAGEKLYQTNCALCHGQSPDARVYGADYDKIKGATIFVSEMKVPQVFDRTDSELQLISQYLMSLAGLATVPTGQPPGSGNTGTNNQAPTVPYSPPSTAALQKADSFSNSGMQRLTAKQLARTVELNLNLSVNSTSSGIPANSDSSTYFESDYNLLSVTFSDVSAFSEFAEQTAKLFSATQFVQEVGCTPQGPQDFNCYNLFVAKIGRRFLRRSLDSSEVKRYSDAFMDYAQEDSRFMTAVELALEAFIQHPEFLYRIEGGSTNSAPLGLQKLTDYQVATRMAFLITGRGPDESTLDLAESGALQSPQGRRSLAETLFNSPSARQNFTEFHSRWLGYGNLVLDAGLGEDFLLESRALIEQVNFNSKSDWLNIFSYSMTYLTPKLADHYGISGVNSNQWIDVQGERDGGILHHGSFAAVGSKFNDTSPTLRGYEIYKRLYCGEFNIPIPSNVDTTVQPGDPDDCKTERYAMRTLNNCQACHSITDGIGFGLENIDQFGRFRDVEVSNNSCQIDGEGDLFGQDFQGVKGLSEKISQDPLVGACATEKLFEFMMGRSTTSSDEETLKALEGEYYNKRSLYEILLSIVSSEGFVHKRE